MLYIVSLLGERYINCSMYTSIQIPKPNDEQVLERAPLVLFRCVLDDPNVTTYGRRGQGQQGVDIIGKRDGDPSRYVGIQSKLKGDGKELTKTIVKEEVDKALTFKPELQEYFIITTAPDDAKIQQYARELEVEIQTNMGRVLSIQIWGWGTMEREIQKHPTALKEFYPDYTAYSKGMEDSLEHTNIGVGKILEHVEQISASVSHSCGLSGGAMDETKHIDPLESHIDAEINTYRDKLSEGQPKIAMEMLLSLQSRLGDTVSGRLLFRIKANIASCLLELGEETQGVSLLFEACAHAPEEPKSVANLAFAHLMDGEWEKAAEIGKTGLAADSTNEDLAGFLIQALKFDSSVSDPLKEIPAKLHATKPVTIANLFFLRQREVLPQWKEEASRLRALYPDEWFVIQASAEAILDSLLTEEGVTNRLTIPKASIVGLRTAHDDLLGLWNELPLNDMVLQPKHLALFTNLILSCDLLSDIEGAKKLVSAAPSDALTDNDVAIRIAQLAFSLGDYQMFEQAVQNITSDKPRFHFEFYHALQESDWTKLVEITGNYQELAVSHEIEMVKVARKIALILSFEGEISAQQLLDVRQHIKTDMRGLVLLYDALHRKGFESDANTIFSEAVNLISSNEEFAARAMLAQRAARQNEWGVIENLLEGYIDTTRDNDELRILVTAYVNSAPATSAAVKLFEKLPKHISGTPYYLEREAVFHFNRGALGQSEYCYRAAIDASDKPDLGLYLPLLTLLMRRQKHDAISKLIAEMLKLEFHGSGKDKSTFAHFLMEHGEPERAVNLAYQAMTECPESPEVHSAYCTLILMNTRLGVNERVIPITQEAKNGCWVLIQSNDGDVRDFLIANETKTEASHLFKMVVCPQENSFAQSCIGKTVGDTFEQTDGFGIETSVWTIEEIKHKYSHACHIVMDEFDVRFPNSRLFGHMKMVDNNVQPVLDFIQKRAENSKTISDYYTKQGFPISVVAAFQGGSSIEYVHYLRSIGNEIHTCRGLHVERENAESLITDQRMNGAVIDAYTAWTIATIDGFEAVKKVFGKLYIAQSCLDEITKMLVESENEEAGKFSIAWQDGVFYRNETSKADLDQKQSYLKGVHDQISKYCEALPSESPNQISKVSRELIENFSSDLLDPAFCANNRHILLCEDMFYRQLAEQECSVKGTWLQPVLMFAVANKLIATDDYCRMIVALANKGHRHLALSSSVLVKTAITNFTGDDFDFISLADLIGTRTADIYSHFSVVSETFKYIWVIDGIKLCRKKRLSGILLENLLRYRAKDWHFALAALFIQADLNLRSYIVSWIDGHFLSQQLFNEAVAAAFRAQFQGLDKQLE